MPETPQKILVAVAWPYASGPRHLGHVAGPGVPSDIFARYHRLKGNDVLMVSGTDEHGTPVMVSADREGVTPRELADRNNALILDDYVRLGMTYDCFTRTTTRNHYAVVQDMFRTLYEKGFLIEQSTLGAISPATGRTLPDRYIEGTCPICGYGEARGDQCDNCGNQLDPVDLIDPRSVVDGSTPEFRETTHLFLDLPRFRERLVEWIEAQTHWRPERPQLRAQPRAGGEAACDDPRHRLGRSGSGRGLSRGHEAHLRLVRRGDRLPLRHHRVGAQRRPARGVARVVAEPGRAQLLLHGQGQHRLPHGHLALDADGLRRRPAASVQRRLERVPDHERQQGEHESRSCDLGQGRRRPLRA